MDNNLTLWPYRGRNVAFVKSSSIGAAALAFEGKRRVVSS
jgi:hypothetical protein